MKNKNLAEELVFLLNKGNAHAALDTVLQNIPFHLVSQKPHGLPYSIWSVSEHLRIAQWDILQYCKNPNHTSPEWPKGYWPAIDNPEKEQWVKCIRQIEKDRNEFNSMILDSSEKLLDPIPHTNGQSLLREALVLADHNSYHTGAIIILRRLLGIWPK